MQQAEATVGVDGPAPSVVSLIQAASWVPSEERYGPIGVLAVPHRDSAITKRRHLDALVTATIEAAAAAALTPHRAGRVHSGHPAPPLLGYWYCARVVEMNSADSAADSASELITAKYMVQRRTSSCSSR